MIISLYWNFHEGLDMVWFISFIVKNVRVIIPIIGSAVFFILGYVWTFILMGYNTEAKVEQLQVQVNQQQTQITSIDRTQAQIFGLMESIKEDTSILKKTLIEDALKRQTR